MERKNGKRMTDEWGQWVSVRLIFIIFIIFLMLLLPYFYEFSDL